MADERPWIDKDAGEVLRAAEWNRLQVLVRRTLAAQEEQVARLAADLRLAEERIAALEDGLARHGEPVDLEPETIAAETARLPAGRQWLLNKRSNEAHHHDCPAVKRMSPENRFPADRLLTAAELGELMRARGSDGCRICLGALHRR